MLDITTGEVMKMTVMHEGNHVREFYCKLTRSMRVGIEVTGSMQWFVKPQGRTGNGMPGRSSGRDSPRKQKHDRRDADLIPKLLVENRFPAIWLPPQELQGLRSLLRHCHQWVRLRTRIQNALPSIALAVRAPIPTNGKSFLLRADCIAANKALVRGELCA
jgi:hypothetical protein